MARVIAAAAVAGLLAVVAVVVPLAQPASAASYDVTNAEEFHLAVAAANAADELYTINIIADLQFPSLDPTPVLTADVDVTIDGNSHTMSCGEAGTCDTWLDVELLSTGGLGLVETHIEGFQQAVTVSESDVTISNCWFTENGFTHGGPMEAYGAALYVINNLDSAGPEDGKSLYNVAISNTYFEDNYLAIGDGGAVGGAVYIEGDVTIDGSHFISNTLAVENNVSFAFGGALALVNSEADIEFSDFSYNSATTGIGGPGNLTDFDAGGGAMSALGSDVSTFQTTFSYNETDGAGGAIYTTEGGTFVEDSTLSNNDAAYGGAIFATDADAAIVDSTVDGNSATERGGAVMVHHAYFQTERSTYNGNSAGVFGGAINVNDAGARLDSSLFSGNSAPVGGAVNLFNSDPVDVFAAEVNASASTFTGNTAQSGAAINVIAAYLEAQHLTIARNTATGTDVGEYPGQLSVTDGAYVDLSYSVITENLGVGEECAFDDTVTIDSGFNVVNDESCELSGPGDLQDFDLNIQLSPLQFYGGPTWVMVPDQGSILIDYVEELDCVEDSWDQRDVARPQDDGCDVGAVETFEPVMDMVNTPAGPVWFRVLNAVQVDEPDSLTIASLSSTPPAGVVFPYGALGFEIDVWGPGWPVDVELVTPTTTNALWKFQFGEWYQYPATRTVYDTDTVWAFRLIDGGDGDEDGAADETIHDPVAPGLAAAFTG